MMRHTQFKSPNRQGWLLTLFTPLLALLLTPIWVERAAAAEPAASQPASQPASQSADAVALHPGDFFSSLATSPRLTGDWFGARTALQNVGFSFQPVLATGYFHNFRGGVETRHSGDFAGVGQYNIEFDFDKAKIIPGASFFIRGMSTWNDGIKAYTGSLSTPAYVWGSSGDHSILVDKWWWRQRFLNDRVELRVGKLLNIVDLFDVNAYAANMYSQFSNSALCANATLPVSKGIGAFLKIWPTDWLYLQAGAMDPDQVPTHTGFDTAFHGPDHFRGYWEVGLTPKWDTARGKMPGNYRVGWWYDTQAKKVFRKTYDGQVAPRFNSGDMGAYLDVDQLIWKENDNPKDKQGLGLFARWGVADGDMNRISHFWSVGGQYEGLLPTRDHDVLAFGVAQSRSSSAYEHAVNRKASDETVYEFYYAAEIFPWMTLTPDLQVIHNPGALSTARDSIVAGIRLKITF